MTKRELLADLQSHLEALGMDHIELPLGGSVGSGCNKATIEGAIRCLDCDAEEMDDYLAVLRLAYPNICANITANPDWMTHPWMRFYVYATARAALR